MSPPAAGDLPAVPFEATIRTFNAADAVGRLVTASGTELRFGRSACKGFEPVVDAKVVVHAAGPHPLGGLRATELRLPEGDVSYDALLSARDQSLGVPQANRSEEAIGVARMLGWITVLFDAPIPNGVQATRAWAEGLGLAARGIQVETEQGLSFRIGTTSVRAYAGDVPFPRESMDLRRIGEDFDPGRGFLVLSLGDPGLNRMGRMIAGQRDPWGPDGQMRNLSRLAAALAPHARGVVLNRAGELTLEADRFVDLLGDLDDPDCKPFGAWLDVARTPAPNPRFRSFGMAVFGLPDVSAPVRTATLWELARLHEAVLLACAVMVREGRELQAGETLRAPVGVQIGAYPHPLPEGDADTYSVREDEGRIALEPSQATDPAAAWARASASGKGDPALIAANTYQAHLRSHLHETVNSELLAAYPSRNPNRLPHQLELRRHAERGTFLVVTNGFGRIVQAGGVDAGLPHIELMAEMADYSPEVLDVVGTLASGIDLRQPTDGAWKPGDTLRFELPARGIAGFVLAGAGKVALPGGAPVQLLMAVPLTASEYAQAREQGSASVLRKLSDEQWYANVLERWVGSPA